jgi:putative ABC transport system ATP-binding protein
VKLVNRHYVYPTRPTISVAELLRLDARPKDALADASPVAAAPLFAIEGLSKSYRDAGGEQIAVLRRVSIEIPGDGLTALIGPSGQGKSTLLNLLGGLDTDYAGRIFCRGATLPREEGDALRRYRAREVSFVFQDLNLISHLTAAQNVALPLICRGEPRAQSLAAAARALDALGIGELWDRRPASLSGGQRQRVGIARAFASRSKVVLADEPTGSLDPANARRVMAAFSELCRHYRRPCLLVTHNVELAEAHCDRILRIAGGTIQDVTPPAPVVAAES